MQAVSTEQNKCNGKIFVLAENNWDGCHSDHNLPCYKNELACSVSVTTLGGGKRFQLDSNGIPDHNSWALTGSTSVIAEASFISTFGRRLNRPFEPASCVDPDNIKLDTAK